MKTINNFEEAAANELLVNENHSEINTTDNLASSACLIRLSGVHKRYQLGKTTVNALNGVSFSINRGEFTAIAGPSGSGKTTILNLIGCIDDPTSGTVLVKGKNHQFMKDREASIFRNQTLGYIFQNFNLIPVLSVYENIEYPLRIGKIKIDRHTKEKIYSLIEDVGLSSYTKQRPDKLSGGQRQRVAVARALVCDPDIVMADEPTANLDHNTGLEILNLMQKLNRRLGTTFVISTHSEMIIEKSRRVIRVLDGKIESDTGEDYEYQNKTDYDTVDSERATCSA
ncbi:MAG: ABC transporter ATP-binding protein [Spirochaetes bacterium]|nr:ABC transporter ATP-binding protein [Spirochaetota bacterium]MBN2769371.1 ABC transporter ATP-binding protein [Spirochaetota bacterium]